MKIFPINTNQKGYTLLFAVLVAILVLSIGAFILSVSRKQFILASTARDSMIAVYAADSGIECAVRNYFIGGMLSTTSISSIYCGAGPGTGFTIRTVPILASGSTKSATTTFFMPLRIDGTATGVDLGLACVAVSVGFNVDTAGNRTVDIIEARGYNIGWNNVAVDCSRVAARKVERGLRLSYQ